MLYFVVDLDGTICDSIPRVKAICEKAGVDRKSDLDKVWTPEQMEEFLSEENVLNDGVIKGSEKIFEFADKVGATIVFLTGRSDFCRPATEKWILKNFGERGAKAELLMRPPHLKGKCTADAKESIFLEWRDAPWKQSKCVLGQMGPDHFIFFEDQREVVEKYSKHGLVLCSPECWSAIR